MSTVREDYPQPPHRIGEVASIIYEISMLRRPPLGYSMPRPTISVTRCNVVVGYSIRDLSIELGFREHRAWVSRGLYNLSSVQIGTCFAFFDRFISFR